MVTRVEVFYVTDRARQIDRLNGQVVYQNGVRGRQLEYGKANVQLAAGRAVGSLTGVQLAGQLQPLSEQQWLDACTDRSGEVFVFVHGFNNTLTQAIQQIAQIVTDLGQNFRPRIILVSWASYAQLWRYLEDEVIAQQGVSMLTHVLRILMRGRSRGSARLPSTEAGHMPVDSIADNTANTPASNMQ